VLLLNTVISQGAFRQNELEIDLILLAEEEEDLARSIQVAESPVKVEKAARKLGMVPAAAPVFLSLADGKILGEPVPAVAEPGRVSFKGAPGIRPTPKPTPTAGDAAVDPATEADTDAESTTGTDATTDQTGDPEVQGVPGADPGAEPTDQASPAPQVSPTATPTGLAVNQ
jgi:hypothetical protein